MRIDVNYVIIAWGILSEKWLRIQDSLLPDFLWWMHKNTCQHARKYGGSRKTCIAPLRSSGTIPGRWLRRSDDLDKGRCLGISCNIWALAHWQRQREITYQLWGVAMAGDGRHQRGTVWQASRAALPPKTNCQPPPRISRQQLFWPRTASAAFGS